MQRTTGISPSVGCLRDDMRSVFWPHPGGPGETRHRNRRLAQQWGPEGHRCRPGRTAGVSLNRPVRCHRELFCARRVTFDLSAVETVRQGNL
jgi:hypothetical protein